jgi:hypothetical protein
MPELFARLQAQGGRLVRRDGVVSVEAPSVTPEMAASVQAHRSDLLLLVPEAKPEPPATPEPTPEPYPDADAVMRAISARGGRVLKDEHGRRKLELPEPDAVLEDAFWRQFFTEEDFYAELRAM